MRKTSSPQALDGYSEKLIPISEGMWEYEKSSSNGCYISQGSLQRILFYLSNVTFGMVYPFILADKVSNNVERLSSCRASIQSARIKLYHLVAKLLEKDSDTYTIDKGFILIKPDHMTKDRFSDFMRQTLRNYDQEAFVIRSPDEDLLCVDRDGEVIQTYSGNLSVNLLAKAYSCRLPKSINISLMGTEVPNGSLGSFQIFKGSKVQYYLPEDFFKRKKVKPENKKG